MHSKARLRSTSYNKDTNQNTPYCNELLYYHNTVLHTRNALIRKPTEELATSSTPRKINLSRAQGSHYNMYTLLVMVKKPAAAADFTSLPYNNMVSKSTVEYRQT